MINWLINCLSACLRTYIEGDDDFRHKAHLRQHDGEFLCQLEPFTRAVLVGVVVIGVVIGVVVRVLVVVLVLVVVAVIVVMLVW